MHVRYGQGIALFIRVGMHNLEVHTRWWGWLTLNEVPWLDKRGLVFCMAFATIGLLAGVFDE